MDIEIGKGRSNGWVGKVMSIIRDREWVCVKEL